jgi:hypothetical protein
VRFECAPADDLSFEAQASWPPTALGEGPKFERAIAESVADELLAGVYQHSGCSVTLVEVRYDEVGSSEAAFMSAAKAAMQNLLRPVARFHSSNVWSEIFPSTRSCANLRL